MTRRARARDLSPERFVDDFGVACSKRSSLVIVTVKLVACSVSIISFVWVVTQWFVRGISHLIRSAFIWLIETAVRDRIRDQLSTVGSHDRRAMSISAYDSDEEQIEGFSPQDAKAFHLFHPVRRGFRRTRMNNYKLVLDLDETLIHTQAFVPSDDSNMYHEVEVLDRRSSRMFYVKERPHLMAFLREMSFSFELIVFTASIQKYADPVIDLIDQEGLISGRYFRDSCDEASPGRFVKDLSLISNDFNKVVIIDNSPVAYSKHPENAVPITSWIDDPHDDELLTLVPFLHALRACDDVRSILKLRRRGHL